MTDTPELEDEPEIIIGPLPVRRRAARLASVQALYQMDMSGEGDKPVIRQFLDHHFGHLGEAGKTEADEEFFRDVVEGVVAHQAEIDAAVSDHLSAKWSLHRLDSTLRAIMRAGSYEIIRRPDVPALVIIDEYVSIASDFFEGGKEPGFVNGALEKLAKHVRKAEFGLI